VTSRTRLAGGQGLKPVRTVMHQCAVVPHAQKDRGGSGLRGGSGALWSP